MSKDTCTICLDVYSAKLRRKITCQYCPASACLPCQERFLLQSYNDPSCMECKRGWSSEFMVDNFPVSFRNDKLRKHRRKILFEREKALLPAMQVFVEAKKEMARLNSELTPLWKDQQEESIKFKAASDGLRSATTELDIVRYQIQRLKADNAVLTETSPGYRTYIEALNQLRSRREKAKKQITQADKVYKNARKEYAVVNAVISEKSTEYHRQLAIYEEREVTAVGADGGRLPPRAFIMKCPAEDCRGFLSTAYKCGTCAKWACTDCLAVLGTDKDVAHTCKPEEVESAKAIKAETRACPKCGVRIYKIDGCDQMWCTVEGCGTAFSWTTGQIVTGRVHNPHYYEWLRRTGAANTREITDIPCGGMPGFYTLHQQLRACGFYRYEEYATNTAHKNRLSYTLSEIHRNCQEIIDVHLPRHPLQMLRNTNKDADVKYLMNEITEAEWQRQLEMSEARFNRKRDIGFILQTFTTAAADAFRDLCTRAEGVEYPSATTYGEDAFASFMTWVKESFLPDLEKLRAFTNESFKELGKKQRMAVPQIADSLWKLQPIRILYKEKKAVGGAAAAGEAVVPVDEAVELGNEILGTVA